MQHPFEPFSWRVGIFFAKIKKKEKKGKKKKKKKPLAESEAFSYTPTFPAQGIAVVLSRI